MPQRPPDLIREVIYGQVGWWRATGADHCPGTHIAFWLSVLPKPLSPAASEYGAAARRHTGNPTLNSPAGS